MRFNGRNLMAIWATRLHSLTAAGRGFGGRESISPGEGDGAGSNSLPRTIRIAVWEIFSQISIESLCGLGNFFRGTSRYRKIILGQKTLIVRARAPPHRQYAIPKIFLVHNPVFKRIFLKIFTSTSAKTQKVRKNSLALTQ